MTKVAGLIPMRIVAQRTGLTPDVLRAWERRYRAVQPVRSPGGQRHYSEADVERLTMLARAASAGRQISQLVPLSNEELAKRLVSDERRAADRRHQHSGHPSIETYLSTALVAVERFDAYELEQTLRTAALNLTADELLDDVIGPLLFTIGSLWHQGVLRPANEHLATATIRRVLVWMTQQSAPERGAPVIVVATPLGQVHELGAMLAATTAAGSGWRVVYLGANLPADELARAVRHANADALALSIVYPEADRAIEGELRTLRAAVPSQVPIVIGGSGAPSYANAIAAIGAIAFTSLTSLRQWLQSRSTTARVRPSAR